jgi:serine/threonine-protein kinase
VFTGATVVEICVKHAREVPVPPARRAGRPVSPGFEGLLMRCLAKSPDDRPADAAAVLDALDRLDPVGGWTAADAAAWWAAHTPGSAPPPADEAGLLAETCVRPVPDSAATAAFQEG